MWINDSVTVDCREPFVMNSRRDGRMRVEKYRVMPAGRYSNQPFAVEGVGPVLTKLGQPHKGRNNVALPMDVGALPDYVFTEAIEQFERQAAQMHDLFLDYAEKVRQARPDL